MTKLKNTDEKKQEYRCCNKCEWHDCPNNQFTWEYGVSNPEKQGDDWEREFRKRFVRQPAHDMILVVADVEPVIDFIRQLEKQTRESERSELVEDILDFLNDPNEQGSWTKLIDYLHQLKQKTKE